MFSAGGEPQRQTAPGSRKGLEEGGSKMRPVQVIAVTSGKGGVGKTSVSVNMSLALAKAGHNTLLMDADLGLANIDVQLGLAPKFNLSHVLSGEKDLQEIILEGPSGLKVIPAASGIQRMAELSTAEHAGIVQSFSSLRMPLDFLVIDTAAGISDSVVSFTRAAREVLVVVCDEPSSITDAYALIKVLSRDYQMSRFHIVANMVRSANEGPALFRKLSVVTEHYLDVTLNYLGAVMFDEYVRRAVRAQKPVVEAYPGCPASRGFQQVARKVAQMPAPDKAEGQLEFFVERLIEYTVQASGAAL